jgi:hypothetical protein
MIHDSGDKAMQVELATCYQVMVSFFPNDILTRHHLANDDDFIDTEKRSEYPPRRTST